MAVAVALGVTLAVVALRPGDKGEVVDLTTFEAQRAAKDVRSVELRYGSPDISVTLTDGTKERVRIPSGFAARLTRQLTADGIKVTVLPPEQPGVVATWILPILPALLIVGAVIFVVRERSGGGKLGRRQRDPVVIPATRFADLAGAPEVVEELSDVVSFLVDPSGFERIGARMSRGILLVGPPGVGKTLAARAVAGEAGVPFFAVTGSDFVETFVGVGAARVRDLFERARSSERAIVFIDEIDAIARVRSATVSNAAEETERTLNQLLAELDGFGSRTGIFVLAATNRPDILDPAVRRPGRFDRTVTMMPPDLRGRERILALYLERHPVEQGVSVTAVARQTTGFSGAELENLINQAALVASKSGREAIGQQDLERALESIMMGPERRSRVLNEEDRRIVAWHEAGHAVCGMRTGASQAPARISIVPRGPAGGVTWFQGEDRDLVTRSRAEGQLTVLLGGRAAEEVLLDGDVTQGAADDLVKATRLAHTMVTEWGMSRLGAADFDPDVPWRAGSTDSVRSETARLVGEAHSRARAIVVDNRRLIERIAQELLANEQLDADKVADLVRELSLEGEPAALSPPRGPALAPPTGPLAG